MKIMKIMTSLSLTKQTYRLIIAAQADPEGDQAAKPESAAKKPKGTSTKVSKAKAKQGKAKSKATPKPKVSKAKVSEKKKPKKETAKKESHQTDYGKAKKIFSGKCLDRHSFMRISPGMKHTSNKYSTIDLPFASSGEYVKNWQSKKSCACLLLFSQGSYMKVLDDEQP